MTPGKLSARVVFSRIELIQDLLARIRALPIADQALFHADDRNVGAAESYLRRSLEALLDIGRHILARRFAQAVSEYKAIATELEKRSVLTADEASRLRTVAGYRNRLTHFYDEVSPEELLAICVDGLGDVELVVDAYRRWLKDATDPAPGHL